MTALCRATVLVVLATAAGAAAPAVHAQDTTEAPTFTPYTEKPDLVNMAEVRQALKASYPPLLRDAGIGGTASVWVLVDEGGTVVNVALAESSGREAIDDAALEVGEAMRFTPATNRDRPVLAWVRIPVTFSSR